MKTLSLLVGLAMVFPTVAFAESAVETEFNAMDTDRNGYISILEADGKMELLKKWVVVDKNADGQLELSEFSAFEIAPAYIQDEDEDKVNIGAEIR